LEKDHLGSNDLIETVNMVKLKNAVSNGTYTVRAEDLVPKLMEDMFQSLISLDAPIDDSTSRLPPEDGCGRMSPPGGRARKTSSRE
jgi:hypothetical protein